MMMNWRKGRALLVNLKVAQTFKKFHTFYGIKKFNTVFTRACQPSLSLT
jgi:hypothetical protein